MNKLPMRAACCAAALVALAVTGCNGSDNAAPSQPRSGTLSLAVGDTPVDSATAVVIAFTGVEVHSASGTKTFTFDTPKKIDLLQYQGENAALLLDGVTVNAGDYQWIQLDVDAADSSISLNDGSTHDITIPSSAQSGLKLVSGFTVPAGGAADFTIDFDLRKSITEPANGSTTYVLKPALRIENNVEVGTIKGSAANTLLIGALSLADAACGPTVYVYAGANAVPTDIDTGASGSTQPIETATLTLDTTTGNYDYTAGFLAPGDYTLAVTCAKLDVPDLANVLNFSATQTVTVVAKQTVTADFQ